MEPVWKLIEELKSRGVETVHILSRAAAYVMERVDLVICGAEAVVESGAVVSQLGTYSMAIAAHVHKERDTRFKPPFLNQTQISQINPALNGKMSKK